MTNRAFGRIRSFLQRALERLLFPFRGSAPGATVVEYMVVTGFVALFAILAFNRFGRTLHTAYQEEARHVRGEGVPGATNILDDLGGLTDPDGLCNIFTGVCAPGSGMCFVAGTPVATEHGNRPIESLEPGERVWATNVETGEVALKRVVTTFIRQSAEVMTLELARAPGLGEHIEVTPGHHFYVAEEGWARADQLDGAPLLSHVDAVTASPASSIGRVTTVYNIEVEDFHTYHVGESGVLVHNQTTTPNQRNCQGNPGGPGTGTGGTGGGPPGDDDDDGVECGDSGPYSTVPSSSDLERDHVPSGGALRKRTEMLLLGAPLTARQEQALSDASPAFRRLLARVNREGLTIAIPNDIHAQTETFRGRNRHRRQVDDANDLAAAARSNIAVVQAALVGHECAEAYAAAAEEILSLTQADYDARLNNAINALTPEERAAIQAEYRRILRGGR